MALEEPALPTGHIEAAQYLRMSTEHQSYSLKYQQAAIATYAREHSYEITKTYTDAGISGLGIQRRLGLKRLLADVLAGDPGFSVILVYDVSRWGRFQDPDQGAHYEFICREAGVGVEYCAEGFSNDGSLSSTILKGLKRAMAAEFSRELGAKVHAGQQCVAADGFWVGGPPGYGLRRRIVRADGELGAVMQSGEHKSLQSERVTLVAGPPEEVAVVRRIYNLFLIGGMAFVEIARTLNAEHIAAEGGGPWSLGRVRQVLTNEKYVGVNVFGKASQRLGVRELRRPKSTWTRVPGAFHALVARTAFDLVQANRRHHKRTATNEELLESLSELLTIEGQLSAKLIQRSPLTPCAEIYRRRFGRLLAAYERVGYQATNKQRASSERVHKGEARRPSRRLLPILSDVELLSRLSELLAETGYLSVFLINSTRGLPSADTVRIRFGGMRRAYALVGYVPTDYQTRAMAVRGGQSITEAEAAQLTEWARKADPGA